jgi:type VI secretion system protein ImpG
VGFAEGEELLPFPTVSFPGYRLISEYFAFAEKFHFIDFLNLGPLELERDDESFTITVRFSRRPPDNFRADTENFALYVTPIVNYFAREGEPVRVTQLKTAYRVLADVAHPDAFEVISVDEVTGLRVSDQRRYEYPGFYSFDHALASAGSTNDGNGTFYHVTHRQTMAGTWGTYLSLISPGQEALPGEEVLSLSLSCTNGRLSQEVGINEITVPGSERIDFVRFRNITRPTAPKYPRLGEGAEWRFIAHMALSFVTLEDVRALREVLSLYNIDSQPAHVRRIESLKAVVGRTKELLVRGSPVRGTELQVTIDETHFDDEGDLLLFTEVLSRFLGLFAGVNSFTELHVLRVPSEEVLRWPAVTGVQKQI